MTTIVYKDGVLAADSLVTCGNVVSGTATKVFKYKNRWYWGFAGQLGQEQAFFRKIILEEEGIEFASDAVFQAIVIDTKFDDVVCYSNDAGPEHFDAEFYVAGSGSDIATGALAAGATAKEAVQIACKYDTLSGGKVKCITLNKANK